MNASDALPFDCFIVGAQKAGTSTLFSMLARHPAVAGAGPKERHFFDDESRDWDSPDYSTYAATRSKPRQRFGIDASPSYIFWPNALGRLRQYNSAAKIIVSLRDPIDRAFSQWLMTYTRAAAKGRPYPGFSEMVADQASQPPTLPASVTHLGAREVRQSVVLPRGLYALQLSRLREHFPDRQVLDVDFGAVISRQDELASECLDFLGLPPFRKPLPSIRSNPSPAAPQAEAPRPRDVEMLVEYYSKDFETLSRESRLATDGWTLARLLRGDLRPADVADRMGERLVRA